MMCRVTAPLTAIFRREAASRLPLRLQQRFRIARHRALRWFHAPIAIIERDRREQDLGPSVWQPDFRPWPALRYAKAELAPRTATRRPSH